MNNNDVYNYNRVAEAIDYIINNFRDQPDLAKVAQKVHLSTFHFQKLFSDWAGTSPKKFLQYISLAHAKQLLRKHQPQHNGPSLFDVACDTGLSGTSRLHDLFVQIEGMTPAEFKYEGKNLTIRYSFAASYFGQIIVASTAKGVCHMAFMEDKQEELALLSLKAKFPQATFLEETDRVQMDALGIFSQNQGIHHPNPNENELLKVKLHLKGTDFQLKVWEMLLKIPLGSLTTYGAIAEHIGNPGASRAVGTAIGSNPIAYLIPCHRVIQSSGIFGGYMWGTARKTAMIGWESAQSTREF